MKRTTAALLLPFMALALTIGGCSKEYEANMNARKQIAWVQSTNQRLAAADVMEVIKQILIPFEDEWKKDQVGSQPLSGTDLIPRAPHVTNGQPVVVEVKMSESMQAMNLMANVMGKMIDNHGQAELMRARAQAIQYITPIIEAIYSQHMDDFGTPMSTNEVVNNFVNQLPFLATVGGMYALGAKGIDNAGQEITNNASGGSYINNSDQNFGRGTLNNGTLTHGNYDASNHDNPVTTYPPTTE